ncbi:unnamed protein product [Clonostachys rosea f. rosea IK726]|uniref:Uncharacterized protein n=1 Tax=Clonostachys rosea f. rosea IK726 TaxID=1349383 RepID=A0ACA9TLR7_BIOOC|nr:unnamed protein product [Clonostachys rosea f. rosea IK726]
MTSHKPSTIALLDGRTLSYATYGSSLASSTRIPIFYFHGFPSSRIEGALWDDTAKTLDVPLIAIDRPGMGHSTLQQNRKLLDWPDDVLALADHLDIKEFGVLGVSGGGPYALACLSVIPEERLRIGATVCGVYPLNLGAEGILFLSRALFWGGKWLPRVTAAVVDRQVGQRARDLDHPERFAAKIKQQMVASGPKVDKDLLAAKLKDPAWADTLVEALRQSQRESGWGTSIDAGILGSDWGFPLTQVDGKRLVMWHGVLDENSPVRMADQAAELIHPAAYHRLEEEGHASLGYGRMADVLSSLLVKSK